MIVILEFTFDSPLYRFIVQENLPVGSVINTVAFSIHNNNISSNLSYYFEPPSQVFGVLANGSLILINSLDLEQLADNDNVDSNGVVSLNVIIFFKS